MLRNLASVFGYVLILVLSTTASVWAAEYGTPDEAKALLERAVAALKEVCSPKATANRYLARTAKHGPLSPKPSDTVRPLVVTPNGRVE
jgi:hypothetical protein